MKVGRTVRVLTDCNRKELLNDVGEHRKIIISIFYPTNKKEHENKPLKYIDLFHPCQGEFIKRFASDQVSESYLEDLMTNTYSNVSISERENAYPVIIYSPGLGMDRDSSIFINEYLARKGYVVFTIGHTYDSNFTIFPNGEIIEQAKHIAESTLEEKQQLINIRKEDILYLLEELEKLNVDDDFIKGRLDLNKIGIMGHSLGGASVFKAATEDKRIKAAVMLDGSLQYINLKKDIEEGKNLNTPFLNFRRGSINYEEEMKKAIELYGAKTDGDTFKKRIIMRNQTLIGQIEGQKTLYPYLSAYKSFIKLNHSEHMTFTDWSVIYNKEMINDILPVKKAHEIISEITNKFFNEFLCGSVGEYSNYINCNSYPEISLINKDGEVIKSEYFSG